MVEDSFMLPLENILDQSIKNLESKKSKLNEQIRLYEDLKNSLTHKADEVLMISLGGGYYARMAKEEVNKYMDRCLERARDSLSKVALSLEHALQTAKNFRLLHQHQAEKEDKAEDELPIIDIQEEIDDMGNVVNVQLKDSFGNEMREVVVEEETLNKEISLTNIESHMTSEECTIEEVNDISPEVHEDHEDQISELLQDMGLVHEQKNPKTDHKELLIQTQIQNRNESTRIDKTLSDVPCDYQEPNSLVTSQLYELELLANDVEDHDFRASEESEFDYDFEETESDDDYDDEMSYGLLLPRNEIIQNRLWQEIENLRRKKEAIEQPKGEKSSRKSVRFSEKLDIKEVENYSNSSKDNEQKRTKILKFKENKMKSGTIRHSTEFKTSGIKSSEAQPITTDIVEHDIPKESDQLNSKNLTSRDGDNDVNGNEKGVDELQEELKIEKTKESQSKFKKLIAQDPRRKNIPRVNNLTIEVPQTIPQPISEAEKADDENETAGRLNSSNETVKRLNIDLPNLQDDLDAMVQAYNVGMFDDDIEVSGPIVDRVEDFETLNRIVDSMPDNSNHIDSPDGTEDMDLNSSSDSDQEVLKDLVVENEFITPDDDVLEPLDLQQSVLNQEVSNSYHRLRQKILSREPALNQEFEPTGDMPKTSRFRAARRKI